MLRFNTKSITSRNKIKYLTWKKAIPMGLKSIYPGSEKESLIITKQAVNKAKS